MFWTLLPVLFMLASFADVLLSDSSGGMGSADANLTPLLIQHIINNSLDAAYDLIAMGESSNVRELPSGWTPLIYAASAGNTELARHLILAGAEVNTGCVDGWTPLMFASVHGRVSTMELLIEHGSNIHQVSSNGATALGCAKLGGVEAAISLVEHALHADRLTEIFVDRHGVEAIILTAAHTGDSALVQRLLLAGHSPNTVSSGGWTPLMLAAASGCVPCLPLLLRAGALVDFQDRDGWTALMFCAHSGNVAGVRVLVDAAADVLLVNHDDFNALHLSRAEGHDEAFHAMVAGSFCEELLGEHVSRMMLMIDDGVDPNYVCASVSNYTPLIVAVKAQDEAAVAELLADEHVNVNAVEHDHWSPLMFASLRKSEAIIRLLLASGADRELVTTQGYSVIRLAQMYNMNNDVVLGLLENGLDFTSSPSVYLASEKERKENHNKNVEVDTIVKKSTDREEAKKGWSSSVFSILKKHSEDNGNENVKPSLLEAKKEKNLLTSIFGWL